MSSTDHRRASSRAWLIPFAGIAFFVLAESSSGQDPPAAPPADSSKVEAPDSSTSPQSNEPAPPPADEPGQKVKEYRDLKIQLSQLEETIHKRLMSATLGSTERYKKTMAEIADLRAERSEKNAAVLLAAVEAYLEAPDKYREVNEDMTRYLRSLLGEQTTTGEFAPQTAVEVAQRLIDAGSQNLNVLFYGSHAAYCQNNFELARQWLELIEKRGAAVDPQVKQQVLGAADKWTREMKFRETDTLAVLPQALIKTELGDITVELFENEAPNTVANFIYLAEKKYFDGTYVFFSQPGRMWTAGCTRGDGTTNAGYYIPDEVDRPEARHHFAGSLAMSSDAPNTNSSLFSIFAQPTPAADGKSTVFGRVLSGMDIVHKTPTINPASIATGTRPTKILSVSVIRKKSHPYEPQTLPLPDFLKSDK